MKNIKYFLLPLIGCVGFSVQAKTEEVLLFHHFLSPKAPAHAKLFVPWIKKLEKDSNSRIKIEIFPSMTMGGKPSELYKQVRSGAADIVWAIAGYTPGVFPRTEVYELPTVHKGDALVTNIAIRENFDLIKEDFKDIVPLLIHTHAGNAIHTTTKKIQSVADLKSLKLRTPSRTGGWLISALGAEPTSMPMPALPQALSKNAIDGALIPFEVFPPYKFHQLTRYSTEGRGGLRFGTSVFMLLMNKERFNKMSKDLQKIIMKNSDMALSIIAGEVFTKSEIPGKRMQNASKNSAVIELDQKATDAFNKVGNQVVDRWIKEANSMGIDGQKLVNTVRKAINR